MCIQAVSRTRSMRPPCLDRCPFYLDGKHTRPTVDNPTQYPRIRSVYRSLHSAPTEAPTFASDAIPTSWTTAASRRCPRHDKLRIEGTKAACWTTCTGGFKNNEFPPPQARPPPRSSPQSPATRPRASSHPLPPGKDTNSSFNNILVFSTSPSRYDSQSTMTTEVHDARVAGHLREKIDLYAERSMA